MSNAYCWNRCRDAPGQARRCRGYRIGGAARISIATGHTMLPASAPSSVNVIGRVWLNPADGLLEFTSRCAPRRLLPSCAVKARQVDLAAAIMAVLWQAPVRRWGGPGHTMDTAEPVSRHHGQQLFGETAGLRCGLYARSRWRSAHWCVDHSAPRFK
jgi:hypothetical protein